MMLLYVLFIVLTAISCSSNSYEYEDRKIIIPEVKKEMSEKISSQLFQTCCGITAADNVYITDVEANKIKVFDKKGNMKDVIGRGQGQGPGEVSRIGGFDIHNDTISIVDIPGRKIVRYSKKGRYIDQFRVDHPINKIEVTKDAIFARDVGPGHVLWKYTRDGEKLIGVGTGKNMGTKNLLTVAGHMEEHPHEEGEIIYVMSYKSIIMESSGEEMRRRDTLIDRSFTIDDTKGESEEGEGPTRYKSPNPAVENTDIEKYKGNIYILTHKEMEESGKGRSLLDVYGVKYHRYKKTYILHEGGYGFSVQSDTVYAITRSGIVVYDISEKG